MCNIHTYARTHTHIHTHTHTIVGMYTLGKTLALWPNVCRIFPLKHLVQTPEVKKQQRYTVKICSLKVLNV